MMPAKIDVKKYFKKAKHKRIVKGFSLNKQFKEGLDVNVSTHFTLLERKKTVICEILVDGMPYTERYGESFHNFVGKAICHPDDEFNLETGMKIALEKAEEKMQDHIVKISQDFTKALVNMSIGTKEMIDTKHASMIRKKEYKLRP